MLYSSDSIQFASAQGACMSNYVVSMPETPSQSKLGGSTDLVSATAVTDGSSGTPSRQRSQQASPTTTTKQTSALAVQPPAPKKQVIIPIHVVEFGEITGEVEVDSDTTFAELRKMVLLQLMLVL